VSSNVPPPPNYGGPGSQPPYAPPGFNTPQGYPAPGAAVPPPPPPVWATSEPTPAPPKKRSGGKIAVVIVAVLAVLAGGVFAVSALTGGDSDEGGAKDPQAAVQDLFDAVSKSDALGTLDSLAPSERGALKDPVVDMVEQLKRLEILADDFDLSSIGGVELTVSDLQLSDEELAPGVTAVTIEGGRSRGSIDPSAFPFGDFIRDHVDVDSLEGSSGSGDLVDEDEGEPPVIVTLEEGGKWYVSLWFSIAENARVAAGADEPDFANPIPGEGSATPEDAARALIDAGTQLDLNRLVALTPPDEMKALHTYATLFLDDGQQTLDQFLDDQGISYSFDITDFQASSDVDGDVARVKIDKLAFEAEFRYQDTTVTVEAKGDDCVDITFEDGYDSSSESFCTDDLDQSFADSGVDVPQSLIDLSKNLDLRVVTTKVDGQWYVSPVRTGAGVFTDLAKAFDRQDLDDLVDFIQSQGI
jgi:hypothetical protein